MIILLLRAADITVLFFYYFVVVVCFAVVGMEPFLFLFIMHFLNYSYRISVAGYTIHRVPFDLGRYKALEHGEDKHNPINPDR